MKTLILKSLVVVGVMILAGSPALAKRVKLNVDMSQAVFVADKSQTAYLKIGLAGMAENTSGKRAPVNVAFVLDRSGSMSGEKLRQAKQAAIMAIRKLSADDIVSVVAYDDYVQVLIPATKVSDRYQLINAINRLSPGGSTALFAGVSKGAAEVRKFISKNQVNRVILLSDGLANVGPSSPYALANLGGSLIKEGISVTTIGLGLGYNEDLMVKLAQNSDGNHAFVEHPRELARIFNYEFGDLLSAVAQDVEIIIQCAPGIRPIRLLGRPADIVGQQVVAKINQIYGRQEKYLLLEVEVPSKTAGSAMPVAMVEVNYADLIAKKRDQLNGVASVTFSSSSMVAKKSINKAVMINSVEQIANETNKRAVELRDQGKLKGAKKLLDDNSDYLQMNSQKYGSKRLKDFEMDNRRDADNLDEKNWNRQRKSMRNLQNFRGTQQSYH
jgi:Ca-activated chloride channel family protein